MRMEDNTGAGQEDNNEAVEEDSSETVVENNNVAEEEDNNEAEEDNNVVEEDDRVLDIHMIHENGKEEADSIAQVGSNADDHSYEMVLVDCTAD